MRSDNKVCELTTVCLPWQQWTETSVWFDDVGISAFHNSPFQTLPSHQSECVLVCHCVNVRMNTEFLVKLGKSGSKIIEMLVQI
jgi:hypothetical protein